MRTPMTIRIAASAPTGTQAISPPRMRKASNANAPSMTPDQREVPPELRLTSVAPMVPAPGMPPNREDAMLALPCANSSRLD